MPLVDLQPKAVISAPKWPAFSMSHIPYWLLFGLAPGQGQHILTVTQKYARAPWAASVLTLLSGSEELTMTPFSCLLIPGNTHRVL